jgi:hypothetical protein
MPLCCERQQGRLNMHRFITCELVLMTAADRFNDFRLISCDWSSTDHSFAQCVLLAPLNTLKSVLEDRRRI